MFCQHLLPQHPPQCHCPPVFPLLFSLLGRFRFRLCQPVFFQQETNSHASCTACVPAAHPTLQGTPPCWVGLCPGAAIPWWCPRACLQLSCLERALVLLHWDRRQIYNCSLSCSLWLPTLPLCPRDVRCVLSPDFPLFPWGNSSQSLQWQFLWGMAKISPG